MSDVIELKWSGSNAIKTESVGTTGAGVTKRVIDRTIKPMLEANKVVPVDITEAVTKAQFMADLKKASARLTDADRITLPKNSVDKLRQRLDEPAKVVPQVRDLFSRKSVLEE